MNLRAASVVAVLAVIQAGCGEVMPSFSRESVPDLGRQIPTVKPAATLNAVLSAPDPRWAVVNYWHFFCGPCLRELPALEEFARTHPEIRVSGVSYFFDPAEISVEKQLGHFHRAVLARGVTFPTMIASSRAELSGFKFKVLPTTLLVSPSGKVEAELRGAQGIRWFLIRAAKRVHNAA